MKDFGLKKLYYSISEVSKLTGLEQYILRYWETEFEQLNPSKNRAGNRIYTNKNIKLILTIKKLLRDQKYTIEGAKKILAEKNDHKQTAAKTIKPPETKQTGKSNSSSLKDDLVEIRNFLVDLNSKI
ncbi:Transcriptional regulator PA2737, MerR family [hydrothermal vent metagenome]|uniref:Transcriptional regulator PA2737, MerR family n=1 Tax=hydrothermal vent metagenome TaxID=652676 RepID=A0A3B1D2L2_9ZZZZ